jgi:hypothetical protein
MRGAFIATILLLTLAGCGGNGRMGISQNGLPVEIPPEKNWKVERKPDRLTDRVSLSATNASTKARVAGNTGFAAAILNLSCGHKGPMALLYWGFPVGRNGVAIMEYRFDSQPAQRPHANFFNTETVVIEQADDMRTFLEQARLSSALYMQVSSVTGQSSADFNTTESDKVVDMLLTECPLPAAAAAIPKKRK